MTVRSGDLYYYEATCKDKDNKRVHLDIVSEKSIDNLNPSNCILNKRGFNDIIFYEVSVDRLKYLRNRKGRLSIYV